MGLIAIKTRRKAQEPQRFLHNGMKPFFLLAAGHSVISMVWWMAIYTVGLYPTTLSISPFQWHAHELIYGYTVAVIAGFLLAALPEWTNVATIAGRKLGALLALWALPRILFLWGTSFVWVATVFDLLFSCALLGALVHPIVVSRSWRQSGVLSKVLLLAVGNLCFYLGALGSFPYGLYLSTYGGVYLVISLILTVGGRVLPGFIQNAIEQDTPIAHPRWISVATMALFVVFFILELTSPDTALARYVAICLGIVTSLRLYWWYAAGIWSRPLLWGLYLSFASIALGFLLFGTTPYTGASKTVALHAFTVGGIGLATLSVMIRAALGHSGGDVRNPPRLTTAALLALVTAGFFRVLMPLVLPTYYGVSIAMSQIGWIVAYALLLTVLLRIFLPGAKKQRAS